MSGIPIVPVILCGGEGSRLWPVSRRSLPKQFARLVGDLSFFQQAVQSLVGLEGVQSPVIVTGAAHESTVLRQLDEIGVSATIIVEPEGRDSAPAIMAAAEFLSARFADCVAIMQPADHHIPDRAKFQAAAATAARAAQAGHIVTFGIVPTGPDIAYGYISKGADLPSVSGAATVSHFAEKPSRERAQDYLAKGYVWNSGIFAFRPAVLRDEMAKYEPEIVRAVASAVESAKQDGGVLHLDPASFSRATKKSLDHAVMEHTPLAAVVPADFRWSDLGAWSAIHAAQEKDERGNAVYGEHAVVIESTRCLIRSPLMPVAVIGLEDVGVIVESDSVLVCRLDASPSVKTVVEHFRASARPEVFRATPARNSGIADLASAARFFSRWLNRSALPLWWSAGADHVAGGFQELLDQDAAPVATARRLRVQARQIYVFAHAGLAGWNGPWKTAVEWGLNYLPTNYRKADGFYRTLINAEGQPADDAVFLYDQAFVLLALAAAARSSVEVEACREEAAHLLSRLNEQRKLLIGGYSEQPVQGSVFQSNPHMHLLEATLEWCELEKGCGWENLARSLVQQCLAHFIDPESGALREFFQEDGAPMEGAAGKIVEPGHQFEWAWLLARWAKRTGDANVLAAARRLQQIGEAHGVDATRRVAIDALSDDMSLLSRQARLWPQTERLKAAVAVAEHGDAEGKLRAEAQMLEAARGLSYYLQTETPGLWHDKMRADGTFIEEPAPASSLYHLSAAISELVRYVGTRS